MTAAPHARAFDAIEAALDAEIADDTMRGKGFATAAVVRPMHFFPALGNATADPSRPKSAIERAGEWAEAVGCATRTAHDICRDCPMDWPRRDVLVQWHLFAWATRVRRDLVSFYRSQLRRAIGRYRKVR